MSFWVFKLTFLFQSFGIIFLCLQGFSPCATTSREVLHNFRIEFFISRLLVPFVNLSVGTVGFTPFCFLPSADAGLDP